MTMISDAARGLVRRAGLAAIAAVAVTAASHQRADALSLASPAALPSAKSASEGMTIEVRGGHGGHHGGGFRSGGGFRGGSSFHGGGFRGGGMAFRGGGYRAAHIYRGGGYRAARIYRAAPIYRYGGGYRAYRHAYHRPYFRRHFHHRHYFHRRYYAPYYSYPRCYYGYRVCRIVWTYYGPRKICRCRPWYRHHYYRYGW
jgi:hypothetical protein